MTDLQEARDLWLTAADVLTGAETARDELGAEIQELEARLDALDEAHTEAMNAEIAARHAYLTALRAAVRA